MILMPDCAWHPSRPSPWVITTTDPERVYACTDCMTDADELPSIHLNEVNGLDCPACGHPCLMLMNGGYITCTLEGCPNPDFADAMKADREQAVVAARIEELERLLHPDLWSHDSAHDSRVKLTLEDRIKTLTAPSTAKGDTE